MKKTNKNNNNATVQNRQGRPNPSADEFIVKMKDVLTGVHVVAGVNSRKMVIDMDWIYRDKLYIKTERLWKSHCTDQRLGKGFYEINGMVQEQRYNGYNRA